MTKSRAELVNLRAELSDATAKKVSAERDLDNVLVELHNTNLVLAANKGDSTAEDVEAIREKLVKESKKRRIGLESPVVKEVEVGLLKKENQNLRNMLTAVHSEVYGARLAAKYLDKELAGRIQQLQLLSRPEVSAEDHHRLWAQLELEIHLHRQKAVIRACRSRSRPSVDFASIGGPNFHHVERSARCHLAHLNPRPSTLQPRRVIIPRKPGEGLGMSITGGQEHGVPILISEIQPGGPAARCGQLFIGDAVLSCNGLDLTNVVHKEAARILSTAEDGDISLHVQFITSGEDSDVDEADPSNPVFFLQSMKYKIFDDEVVSNSSKNNLFFVNGDDGERRIRTKPSASSVSCNGSVGTCEDLTPPLAVVESSSDLGDEKASLLAEN